MLNEFPMIFPSYGLRLLLPKIPDILNVFLGSIISLIFIRISWELSLDLYVIFSNGKYFILMFANGSAMVSTGIKKQLISD